MDAMKKAVAGLMAALAILLNGPLAAQAIETRVASADHESPNAKLSDIGWLVGSWAGQGVRGAPASEVWTSPVGNTMVGTFIQEDGSGAIMFTELMYISEREGSLILRLKHFNPDLTSWEEKNEVEAFRLIALEPCAAFFNALTIRCANPEHPGEGIVVAVRAGEDAQGRVQELVFRYRPQG